MENNLAKSGPLQIKEGPGIMLESVFHLKLQVYQASIKRKFTNTGFFLFKIFSVHMVIAPKKI